MTVAKGITITEVKSILAPILESYYKENTSAQTLKITHCDIIRNGYKNEIWIRFGWNEAIRISTYNPEEVYFSELDFVGLTVREAKDLINETVYSYLK